VYKIVNHIHNLDPETRKTLDHIDGLTESMTPGRDIVAGKAQETLDEAIEKEKTILLGIQ